MKLSLPTYAALGLLGAIACRAGASDRSPSPADEAMASDDLDGGSTDDSTVGDGSGAPPRGDGGDAAPVAAEIAVQADVPEPGDASLYRTGATAYHWRAVWVTYRDQTAPFRQTFLNGTAPGTVLVDFEWPAASSTSVPSSAQFDAELATSYDLLLTEVLGAAGRVLFQVSGPPRWASSRPNETAGVSGTNGRPIWAAAPPDATNDYFIWRLAFDALARWLTDSFPEAVLGGRIAVAYGAELNNHELYGPFADYPPAYAAAAEAVRAASPSLLVGGGGCSNPWAAKGEPFADPPDSAPLMARWLEACSTLGCPIDFLYWHAFTWLPTAWGTAADGTPAGSTFEEAARDVWRWQVASGYAAAAQIVADWTTWEFGDAGTGRVPSHPWLSSDEDTEYKAAYIAASLVAMERGATGDHTIGTLFEQAGLPGELIGDWGLLTNLGVRKPAFNAAAAASRLVGTSRRAVTADTTLSRFVSARAGVSGGELRVLVSRFVPDTDNGRWMLRKALGTRLLTSGYDEASLCSQGLCTSEELLAITASHDLSGFPALEARIVEVFREWFALDDEATAAPSMERVMLRLSGLPAASHNVRLYRVDRSWSNAYTHCVRNAADCSDVAAVNAGPASLQQDGTMSITGSDIELLLELERHAVMLVVVDGA